MQIWTDGSCWPNPGLGGWGWHRCDGVFRYGSEPQTTNNRMEMTAILRSLIELPDRKSVMVYSDSQYCVKGLTEWRAGWRRAGWRKKGQPMPNRDLWLELEIQLHRVNADFRWIKGHNGDPHQEYADALANRGRARCEGEQGL